MNDKNIEYEEGDIVRAHKPRGKLGIINSIDYENNTCQVKKVSEIPTPWGTKTEIYNVRHDLNELIKTKELSENDKKKIDKIS